MVESLLSSSIFLLLIYTKHQARIIVTQIQLYFADNSEGWNCFCDSHFFLQHALGDVCAVNRHHTTTKNDTVTSISDTAIGSWALIRSFIHCRPRRSALPSWHPIFTCITSVLLFVALLLHRRYILPKARKRLQTQQNLQNRSHHPWPGLCLTIQHYWFNGTGRHAKPSAATEKKRKKGKK